MTVIERDKAMHVGKHWFCPGCDTFDGPHHEGYCTVCHEDGTNDATVKEFVPGEQLQQAVDALREIASDECMVMRGDDGPWIDVGRPQRIAQATLERLRDHVPDRR
jgi:hypothetical protein